MSAEVVSLAERRYDPHLSGEARCTACRHEFVVVQPIPAAEPFECPSCTMQRAYRKYVGTPEDGRLTWQCPCNCEVFYLVRPTEEAIKASGRAGRDEAWIVCVGCGRSQELVAIWA